MKHMGTIKFEGNCLFCDVAAGKKEEKIVYEDENFVAFEDANPSAPVHLLIIPRRHVGLSGDAAAKGEILPMVFGIAREIARKMGVEGSYKLLVNAGHSATVSPDHVHVHLIGGWKSPTEVRHI